MRAKTRGNAALGKRKSFSPIVNPVFNHSE